MKTEKWRVHCALADCYYYLKEVQEDSSGGTPLIYCTYPERDLSSDTRPCPYYRMDWQKKMKLVQERIAANKAARLKTKIQTPPSSPEQAQPESEHTEPTKPQSTSIQLQTTSAENSNKPSATS
ncbi:MAG: hypothetical protein N3A72_00445 [bacterium]|nr:hypothetical protein [bacterium]